MNFQTKINPIRTADGQESQHLGVSDDGRAYTEGSQAIARLATDANRESVDLRLALLSRAIEDEIIPRLMLAHPVADDCLSLTPPASAQVSQQDVEAFAKLVLAPDENVAQACIEAMRTSGISVETIYTDLLAPVARYLGVLWEEDLCDE